MSSKPTPDVDCSTYEGLQRVKSTYHRQRSRGRKAESRATLLGAISSQLHGHHIPAAQELIKLLIKDCSEDMEPLTVEMLQGFRNMWDQFGEALRSESDAQTFVDCCIEYVGYIRKYESHPCSEGLGPQFWNVEYLCMGRALLEAVPQRIGMYLPYVPLEEGLPRIAIAMMEVFPSKELEEERNLALARCILTYVGGERVYYGQPEVSQILDMTNSSLEVWADQGIGSTAANATPSRHFVTLMAEALQLKKAGMARLVLARYAKLVDRDPDLQKIAEQGISVHCGEPVQRREDPLAALLRTMG